MREVRKSNPYIRTELKILVFTIFFGFLYWVFESFLDSFWNAEKTFVDHLILKVPPHEIYMRSSFFVFLFIFALIFSRKVIKQKQITIAKLSEQERFDITLRSIGDGVIVTDAKGNVAFMNKAAEKLTGYMEGEAKGEPLHRIFYIINERTREPVESPVDRVLEFGEVVGLANDTLLISKDGVERCIADSGAPIHDEDGKVMGVVLVFQDFTERKQMESKLRKSEDLYRNVVEQVFNGIYIMNENGFEFVNKMYCEITGYSYEELVSPKFDYKILLTDESKRVIDKKLKERESGEILPAQYTYKLKHKSGKLIDVEVNTVLIGDLGNVRVLGTIRDVTRRKQIEEKLKDNERFLTNIFSSIQDGISILDSNMNIVRVNRVMEKWYAHVMPLVGRKCYNAYQGREESCEICPTIKTLETGESAFEIVPMIGPAGEVAGWLDLYSFPLVDKDTGKMAGIIEYVRDITARKRAEDSLKESEVKYRTLFEESRDAIGLTRRDGQFLDVNQAMLELFGYTREEMLGLNAKYIYVDKDDRKRFQERIEKYGSLRDFEINLCKKDGTGMICLVTSTVRKDLEGEVIGYQSIIRDITRNKEAERELKESEERFRNIIEHSNELFYIHDLNHKLQYASLQSLDILGFSPREMLTEWTNLITDNPINQKGIEITEKAMATGEKQKPYILELKRKDGINVFLEIDESPQFDDNKKVVGIVGAARDITEKIRAEKERRSLEAQIQHAQKLESMGVLAGGIAHDFNNLLMGILGNASIALMELAPESPVTRRVQQIETTALHASELTNQMLAYSGKGAFVVQPLNLSRIVEEMAHLLETVISKKAVLKYDFAEQLPLIEGDATQIRQIIMNLITNASDAIGDKSGIITITTGSMEVDRRYFLDTYLNDNMEEGIYIFFEVSDTGIGMDNVTKAKIFDPFFSTKFKGRGLGLAAVLGIVRGHRGAIKVYSEVGRGSSFKVLFPCAKRQDISLEIEKMRKDTEWSRDGTVLVVDDEETVRSVAKMILEKFGFKVLTARDGREGVDLFEKRKDDIILVILDMTMPKLSGEETFREMSKIKSDVPVILSSGYNEKEVTNHFAGKGLAGFIQKPYRPRDLLGVIKAALT